MKFSEIKKIIDNNSVVFADNGLIEATYDLGDSEDAERFANKASDISDKYSGLDIQLDILCDEAFEDEDGEETPEWNIANFAIDFENKEDLIRIKKFLDEIDYI